MTSRYKCEWTHLSVPVRVEDVNDALYEGVLLQLRQGHELVDGQGAGVVQVQLTEPLAQTADLVRVDCSTHTHTPLSWPRLTLIFIACSDCLHGIAISYGTLYDLHLHCYLVLDILSLWFFSDLCRDGRSVCSVRLKLELLILLNLKHHDVRDVP